MDYIFGVFRTNRFNGSVKYRGLGEVVRRNKVILLIGTLSTFVLVLLSFFFLFKANFERIKSKKVLSLTISVLPIAVFVMNGQFFYRLFCWETSYVKNTYE